MFEYPKSHHYDAPQFSAKHLIMLFGLPFLCGCAFHYPAADLSNTPLVQQSGIPGKELVVNKEMLLMHSPWSKYDNLEEPSPNLPVGSYKVTGKVAAGTQIVVVKVQHVVEQQGIFTVSSDYVIGRVLSGPETGRMIIVGSGDKETPPRVDSRCFDVEDSSSIATPVGHLAYGR